jgi:hypothetical protein
VSVPQCCLPDGAGVPAAGGKGHAGTDGADPTEPAVAVFTCSADGEVPTGTNGTDTEDWAA